MYFYRSITYIGMLKPQANKVMAPNNVTKSIFRIVRTKSILRLSLTFLPTIFRKNILCEIHSAGCFFVYFPNAVDVSRVKHTCVITAHHANAKKKFNKRNRPLSSHCEWREVAAISATCLRLTTSVSFVSIEQHFFVAI